MSDPASEMIELLKVIAADVAAIKQAAKAAKPVEATEADLSGQYGNPEVRFDPKFWTGESQVGKRFSQCPPDFLMELAKSLDWSADKAEEKNELTKNGKPVAPFKRLDAARARGWSKRISANPHPAQTGELPF